MKAEVDKLDINKVLHVPTGLNILKTKADNLDFGKLKTVSVDLKILSDVLNKEVVRNTKLNRQNTKANNLENKNPDASTLT